MENKAEILEIGKKIREARHDKGMKLEEVSKLCGLSFSTVSRVELASFDPRLSTVIRIANALGVELDVHKK